MKKERLLEIRKMMENFRCIKKEPRNVSSSFIQIMVQDCTLQNGKTILREQVLKNGHDGSAVIIVPITQEGKILLAIEPRVFTKETVGIGFPAGYIEEGEKTWESAKRELLEETGYQAQELHYMTSFYQDEGCSSAYNTIYIATGCQKIKDQHLDKDEYIRYIECRLEEVYELEKLGLIGGGNAKLALRYLEKIKVKERVK